MLIYKNDQKRDERKDELIQNIFDNSERRK